MVVSRKYTLALLFSALAGVATQAHAAVIDVASNAVQPLNVGDSASGASVFFTSGAINPAAGNDGFISTPSTSDANNTLFNPNGGPGTPYGYAENLAAVSDLQYVAAYITTTAATSNASQMRFDIYAGLNATSLITSIVIPASSFTAAPFDTSGEFQYAIAQGPFIGVRSINFVPYSVDNSAPRLGEVLAVLVPEPASLSLLSAGVLLLARRRKGVGDRFSDTSNRQAQTRIV